MAQDESQTTFNDELRGALFPNDKGGNPSRPDMRGRCVIEGKGYKMSAWTRTAKTTGQRYLSIAWTRDETLDPAPEAATAAAQDDLPF